MREPRSEYPSRWARHRIHRPIKELRRANESLKLASARPGGARLPSEVLNNFVDQHRIGPTTPTAALNTSPSATASGSQRPARTLVGSKGDSHDNALAETINGLYKAEVIHWRSWPTRESVELAMREWVSWFKHHRLIAPIGHISSAEAEANDYRRLTSHPHGGGLT